MPNYISDQDESKQFRQTDSCSAAAAANVRQTAPAAAANVRQTAPAMSARGRGVCFLE